MVKVETERESLINSISELYEKGFTYLVKITAVDYVDHLEVLYFLRNIDSSKDEEVRIKIPSADAWVPTLIDYYRAADWYEREMSEMFGIMIKGRRTGRLLLEKWDGIEPPLRKSFKWGEEYKVED